MLAEEIRKSWGWEASSDERSW